MLTSFKLRTYIELCKITPRDKIVGVSEDISRSFFMSKIIHKYGFTKNDIKNMIEVQKYFDLVDLYDKYHEFNSSRQLYQSGGNFLSGAIKALEPFGKGFAESAGKFIKGHSKDVASAAKNIAGSATGFAEKHSKEVANSVKNIAGSATGFAEKHKNNFLHFFKDHQHNVFNFATEHGNKYGKEFMDYAKIRGKEALRDPAFQGQMIQLMSSMADRPEVEQYLGHHGRKFVNNMINDEHVQNAFLQHIRGEEINNDISAQLFARSAMHAHNLFSASNGQNNNYLETLASFRKIANSSNTENTEAQLRALFLQYYPNLSVNMPPINMPPINMPPINMSPINMSPEGV